MKRRARDLWWAIGILGIVAALASTRADGFWLAMDLRLQMLRGITFEFSGGPDSALFMTFHGRTVTLHYLDEDASDDRLSAQVDRGTYTFSGGRLTVYSDALKHPLSFQLVSGARLAAEMRAAGDASDLDPSERFVLASDDLFPGFGPIDLSKFPPARPQPHHQH